MTPPQQKFYWSLWSAACHANGWHTDHCRLLCDPVANAAKSQWHRQLWQIAAQIAAQEHVGIGLDELRHAAHALALGRPKSSKKFTNSDFSKVKATLELLAAHENLGAIMRHADPEIAQREAFLVFLGAKAEDYVIAAISVNAFGTRDWKALPLEKLRSLAAMLKGRGSRGDAETRSERELCAANAPF